MIKEIQEALARRQETISFRGTTLVVREMAQAASVVPDGTPKEDFFYHIVVACVFEGKLVKEAEGDQPAVYEAGQPALDASDIPALKQGSRSALMPITRAVQRVNGLDAEEEAKK